VSHPAIDRLLQGHAAFRDRWTQDDRDYLRQLASRGQSPDALFVGCSDSRVIPELLTQSAPGQLFVVRNVANQVPPFDHADSSVGAALEYAIGHLHVQHIVVCGHDLCGGVKAVAQGADVRELPSLHEWLAGVRVALAELPQAADAEVHLRAAVEANVAQQLDNLLTFRDVRAGIEAGTLHLHGWVYDLAGLSVRVFDPARDDFVPAGTLIKGGRPTGGGPLSRP